MLSTHNRFQASSIFATPIQIKKFRRDFFDLEYFYMVFSAMAASKKKKPAAKQNAKQNGGNATAKKAKNGGKKK